MKLIDILVQELPKRGGWPDGIEDIEMFEDGCIYFGNKLNESLVDLPQCSDGWNCDMGRYYSNAVTREQYESALVASKVTSWNGEGLPPVGCKCEREVPGGWEKCKINYASSALIVYQMLDSGNEYASTITAFEFRPIRTEADRKRDALISSLSEYFCSTDANDSPYELAKELYDAIAADKIRNLKLED